MATVILLDVSLSMCRPVSRPQAKGPNRSCQTNQMKQGQSGNLIDESLDIKQLANVGLGTLLDHFAQNAQFEHVALIVFSSLWEIRHQFTRQYEVIKNGIYEIELYDKSNIVNAIRGALSLKVHEWIRNGPINIILITDGQALHQSMGKQDAHKPSDNSDGNASDDDTNPDLEDETDFDDIALEAIEGRFNFPCKIQLVCLTSQDSPALKYSIPFYQKLVSIVDGTADKECPVIIGSNTNNLKQSAVWIPDTDDETDSITVESIERLFNLLADIHYKPHHVNLTCGNLSSIVMLSPKPSECVREPLKNEYDELKFEECPTGDKKDIFVQATTKTRLFKLSNEISICGFMPLAEVASPAVISRHLVLPIVDKEFNETMKAEKILSQDPGAYATGRSSAMNYPGAELLNSNEPNLASMRSQVLDASTTNSGATKANKQSIGRTNGQNDGSSSSSEQDITKQPSFSVLLYNSLKTHQMVAMCLVGKSDDEANEEWIGMLHAQTDGKKRSSLMLFLLLPGSHPIPWLPDFRSMGSAQLNADLPQAIRDKITSNRGPVKSYSSNSVIWLDPESVQGDIQKIVRYAKRTPEKAAHFYKELNRIRRAAISYGFSDVLLGLAAILQREIRVMQLDQNKTVNQETIRHLEHAANCLRASLTEESYETNIVPPSQ